MAGKPIHGYSRTPEYRAWGDMKQRCLNPTHPSYKCYGAKGVAVCSRWMDFLTFLADMGPRPSGDHSLDRIDPAGSYEPDNCRWATGEQQRNNRRDKRLITYDGRTQTITQWEKEIGVTHGVIRHRIRKGWSVTEAIETPAARGLKFRVRCRNGHSLENEDSIHVSAQGARLCKICYMALYKKHNDARKRTKPTLSV